LLAGWRHKPRRLVINATPLHRNRSFFTLNSIGTAFCPYRILSEAEFVRAAELAGYRLRDRWIDTAKQVRLPFESGYDVDHYSGFCFDLSSK
jgi:putative methyltransferase (TIGR04325 family)